jgi:hypothetical protein
MTTKRFATCALLALAAAFPATAGAQTEFPPPTGDNYLEPIFVSDPEQPGRFPGSPLGFIVDTTTYTVQADMFDPPASGGPAEPTQCGQAIYGNTVWSYFRSHRWGLMNISTAGTFDSVIGVIPLNDPLSDAAPEIENGACYDGLAGFREEATGLVAPRQWYAVQVGGTGSPMGSRVQVTFDLNPPPKVEGRAFLFWRTGPLRVSDMYVRNVPEGQTLILSCTKNACRKRTINVKNKRAVGKVSRDGWTPESGFKQLRRQGEDAGPRPRSLDRIAHSAAARVKLLRNQKVKRGAKIELRIKRRGFIGQYYRWKVKRNEITSATTRCLNPGSNKPRKKCTG